MGGEWNVFECLPLNDFISSVGGGLKGLLCISLIKLVADASEHGEVPK